MKLVFLVHGWKFPLHSESQLPKELLNYSIIYISCNPETLAKNLAVLNTSHSVKQFALFDQFPYTDHMECGVLLSRRP